MDNKTLTDTLSRNLNISRETVAELIESMSSGIGEITSGCDSVTIPSFGTFEPKKRMERVAIHPASGKRLLVPPKIVLTFRPTTILKQKVNG